MKPSLVLLALLSFGCDEGLFVKDQCPRGTRRCNDNVAETCWSIVDNELTSHTEWEFEDCGASFCQVPPGPEREGAAFCASTREVDPACPAELRDRFQASRCADGQVLTWRYGYRVAEETCSAGMKCADQASTGFDPACDETAFCTPLDRPDPLCTEGIASACADVSTIVHCSCGYRRNAHACEDPGPSCEWVEIAPGVRDQGACR